MGIRLLPRGGRNNRMEVSNRTPTGEFESWPVGVSAVHTKSPCINVGTQLPLASYHSWFFPFQFEINTCSCIIQQPAINLLGYIKTSLSIRVSVLITAFMSHVSTTLCTRSKEIKKYHPAFGRNKMYSLFFFFFFYAKSRGTQAMQQA